MSVRRSRVGGLLSTLFVLLALIISGCGTSSDRQTASPISPSTRSRSPEGKTAAARSPSPTQGRESASTPTESSSATERTSASTKPTVGKTSSTSKPSPTAKTSSTKPARGTALAAIARLTVKGRAPKTGYDRAEFGSAWEDTDDNGCDQRNDVLNRDLTNKTFDGCRVLTGTLHDPYTGKAIRFRRGLDTSGKVQIDHVVPLSDAWQKGAQPWTRKKRERFANDTLNLFAVDGPSNMSKGDGDTATWLPPNKSFRCTYVAHQVTVKKDYGLWATSAETAAMRRVLDSCPKKKLAKRKPIPAYPDGTGGSTNSGGGKDSGSRSSGSGSSDSGSSSGSSKGKQDQGVVHPGAFCAPEGATGRTTKGTPMRCTRKAGETQPRWRSAS